MDEQKIIDALCTIRDTCENAKVCGKCPMFVGDVCRISMSQPSLWKINESKPSGWKAFLPKEVYQR